MASRWHLIDEHEVVAMIADHADQRRLCALLEDMADALPDLPFNGILDRVGQQLAEFARRHQPLEIELFHRLAGAGTCPTATRVLKEIRYYHAIDAIHAEDLAAELKQLSGSARVVCPGELAYMLRCFFDGCRRAIAFEELSLLKLGGERLTPGARSAILASFESG